MRWWLKHSQEHFLSSHHCKLSGITTRWQKRINHGTADIEGSSCKILLSHFHSPPSLQMTHWVVSRVIIIAGITEWSAKGWATFTWWERGRMCTEHKSSAWLSPHTYFPCLPVTQGQSAAQAWKWLVRVQAPWMMVSFTPPNFKWGNSQDWRECRVEKGEGRYQLWPKISSGKGSCILSHFYPLKERAMGAMMLLLFGPR